MELDETPVEKTGSLPTVTVTVTRETQGPDAVETLGLAFDVGVTEDELGEAAEDETGTKLGFTDL